MKVPKQRAILPGSSPEEIFAQRYRWLMGWAMRFTNNDRGEAEDLVQDTFVQFIINRPDLGTIEETVEGYLYAMLRNLHVSQVRRAARLRESAFPISDILSISETASVQTELRMAGQRLQVQDELCRICQYAGIRKNSSKIGSVVILRFFHGYYPNEIAAVTRSSRAGVDKMLQRARNEARLYLKDPESLGFLHGRQPAADLQIRFGQEPEDLLSDLRQSLYALRQGDCLSSEQIRRAYQTKETDRVNPQMLAHVVCCAVCLDEVNRLLSLPTLAEREPEKMTGRDKRDKGNGGSGNGSGSTGDFMEKPRRRLKQVLEHRPKELRVSVNGFILGSHAVNSELNRLSISAKGEEKIGFVEVLSEEEVRLLFCVVAPPPDGPVERSVIANLSDSRNLELQLDFSESWPNINVTYHDPTFVADVSTESERAPQPGCPFGDPARDRVGVSAESESDHVIPSEVSTNRRWARLHRWWLDFQLPPLDWGLFSRPGPVTALFALLLIGALIFTQLHRVTSPVLTAASLLQQSTVAEEALAARSDQVVHRTINLEVSVPGADRGPHAGSPNGVVEATGSAPQLIARQRIEVWQGGGKGITARRLYDDRSALVAGDWRRADGVQTIYHHGVKPQLQLTPEKRGAGAATLTFDNAWQLSPSAKEFAPLVAQDQPTRVQERADVYVISYEGTGVGSSAQGLVRAELILSRADLHATEQTLVVRQANEVRSFHYLETSFERKPVSAVAPAVFEPEPELLGKDTGTPGKGDMETISASPGPPISASPSVVMASAALEVEVLELLQQAGADLGEQVSATRTPEGLLYIKGLVDTEQRKSEILRALAPVRGNPSVRVDVVTAAEAVERQKRREKSAANSEVVQTTEPSSNKIPVFDDLRRYLLARGVAESDLDAEMSKIAIRESGRSRQALQHAWALKRLAERFSLEDLRALDPEAESKWLGLIRSHAGAIQREHAALRAELASVFQVSAGSDGGAQIDLSNDASLVQAVQRLFDLTSTNDERIRAAFSVSAGSASAASVKSSDFWRSLRSAESLASSISRR